MVLRRHTTIRAEDLDGDGAIFDTASLARSAFATLSRLEMPHDLEDPIGVSNAMAIERRAAERQVSRKRTLSVRNTIEALGILIADAGRRARAQTSRITGPLEILPEVDGGRVAGCEPESLTITSIKLAECYNRAAEREHELWRSAREGHR